MIISIDKINCVRCGARDNKVLRGDVWDESLIIECKCCGSTYRVDCIEGDNNSFSIKIYYIKDDKEIELKTGVMEIVPTIDCLPDFRVQIGEITQEEYIREVEAELIESTRQAEEERELLRKLAE